MNSDRMMTNIQGGVAMKTPGKGYGGLGGWIGLLLGLLLLAGCQGGGGTEVGNPTPLTLGVHFASDQELEAYIKEQFAGAVVSTPLSIPIGALPPTADAGAPAGGSEGTRDFSGTNVQEAGVDEADKVKTDGNHLYVAQQDGIRIVQLGAGGALSDVAKVVTDGPVDALYLHNSLLVALYRPIGAEGTDWCGGPGAPPVPDLAAPAVMPCYIPIQAKTSVLMLDVQDPANPLRLSDQVFDGDLVSSRRIGARLHLVSRFMPTLPALEYIYDGTEAGKTAAVERNRAALQGLALDQLVPAVQRRDAGGAVIESGRLLGSETFVGPTLPQGGSIVTLLSFDLDQPQAAPQTLGAVLDARHVYASTTALYLAAEKWDWSAGPGETVLHKFDLSGPAIAYAASGSVPGSILNQFSLGEYQNVLRVATATGGSWSGGSQATQVFCLRQGAAGLEIIGRLENLSPGERLYAARFMGPRGFLVTFVKVDPLFTLDLSDPTAPKIVGELKVPGYSDYIHPLGENHLLTIGKGAIFDGMTTWYQGLQLSIFDLSDFAQPALLFREEIGVRGTESEALHDHKAFTFWAEQGLLAIPVELNEYPAPPLFPGESGQRTFSGLYVYRVDPATGFSFHGRISTAAGTPTGFPFTAWTRGLFVDGSVGSVYAVTPPGVFSAQLSDIANTVNHLDISQ
jgi:Beta propeller domain